MLIHLSFQIHLSGFLFLDLAFQTYLFQPIFLKHLFKPLFPGLFCKRIFPGLLFEFIS